MAVVAFNRVNAFLAESPANPARGLESTTLISNARPFADQAAIDAYVTARGGPASTWFAHAVP